MNVKEVRESDNFKGIYKKLNNPIKIQLNRLLEKVINNPELGKPMRDNRQGTRELYLGSFRLSYLYEHETEILFLLDPYHKDKQ